MVSKRERDAPGEDIPAAAIRPWQCLSGFRPGSADAAEWTTGATIFVDFEYWFECLGLFLEYVDLNKLDRVGRIYEPNMSEYQHAS